MKDSRLKKKKKILLVFFAILIFVTSLFILINSLIRPGYSHKISWYVVGVINKIRYPDKPFMYDDKVINDVTVRYAAHFLEFLALGIVVSFFSSYKYKIFIRKKRILIILLIGYAVPCFDEYIQGFRGRTTSFFEVNLDFCGFICGLLIVWLGYIIKKNREKKNEKC